MQSHCPDTLKSPALIEQVERIRKACDERTTLIDESVNSLLDQWLLPLCAVSPYIARTLLQFPDILPALMRDKRLMAPPSGNAGPSTLAALREELRNALEQAQAAGAGEDMNTIEALQQRVLREFRHHHMVRILWSDLASLTSLEQTLHELSLLAEICVQAADEWSFAALSARFGVPVDAQGREQRLIIIGMGKLGGYELNVSSDIDLVCVYPASGTTRPTAQRQKTMDNGEFFRRSVQRVCKLLNSVTEEGFVYRVDTRLRPFGESGPVVVNLDGLENYYLTQARDWERYAMIKGRALCGDAHDIGQLEQLVRPFVYRRYLDYTAFESLRELKRKIALSLLQRKMVDNIKLGAGGIREIEFIGQAFQLVRGGRESRLRIRPIMKVLRQLGELKLLPPAEVDGLLQAYAYLRRVENGVQMMRDEQVHSLPDNEDDRRRLLHIIDEPEWTVFRHTLAQHQAMVSACFNRLFEPEVTAAEGVAGKSSAALDAARDLWAALSADSIDDSDRQDLLLGEGFVTDESLLSNIATLSRGSFYQRLTAESQQRVERIMPLILHGAKDTAEPGSTLARMLSLVRAVAGRGGYLQALYEQPDCLTRLIDLFSQSRWLAEFVVSQPMVIDEILTNASLQTHPDSVFAETMDLIERLGSSDLDIQMDSLRHYRQAREMRIACAQIDGSMTLMQVSDQLTWLAESIIAGVIALVSEPLQRRFGRPTYSKNNQHIESNVGVLAYGKLGGLELGFGSDLDLVFLHDSQGERQVTDGDKSVDNGLYFSKLAQKFVHFMNTRTPAGVLYEIDLRLRPNGNSGVLITGMDVYADYQQSDAWIWEHQALMRARMVYGSQDLHLRFDEIRNAVLTKQRPAEELRAAVAGMRLRMRETLGNRTAGFMHLKQDAGGVADIEFIVQYLVLANAREHPALLMHTDNIRVLNTVEALELMSVEDCQTLRNSYLILRERLHRLALDNASAVVPMDAELAELRGAVSALRVQVLGETPDSQPPA